MRHLPLTFPAPNANDENRRRRSLGCANGIRLCYTVFRTMTGSWQLTIWLMDEPRNGDSERAYHFPSAKKALDHARADFRRRQVVRLAA